jgi:hypothetical protein
MCCEVHSLRALHACQGQKVLCIGLLLHQCMPSVRRDLSPCLFTRQNCRSYWAQTLCISSESLLCQHCHRHEAHSACIYSLSPQSDATLAHRGKYLCVRTVSLQCLRMRCSKVSAAVALSSVASIAIPPTLHIQRFGVTSSHQIQGRARDCP